ncbi:XRE family transcriptional regulator [Frankia canadensis]|uniref:XRE family transcriptional regulator n=1 Tax=Frankia canadensis TaxID=1836972 RepID=A0A2I2KUV0_9ACTN|nr:helix-turn-helix transcriptional regulator [Frankia canadensis]SNQ49447.1 XRE family transcriptional regulator [Frankia canadensis]SOU56737.1 XRE family transcriptional regulator [Frankia canadensis]
MTLQRASGPIVRRVVLGTQLRRLREAKGLSRADAGYSIRASESKISRLELGRVSFKERDVADLLTLYGVIDEKDRSPLLELTRQANEPGWWQGFTDVMPGWFQPYLGLEEAAVLIRTYELQFIPGLLQTEDYARAVMAVGRQTHGTDIVERRVRARMSRQTMFDRPDAPRAWAIIDEAALWRSVAGPAVMRRQLEHLLALNANPNLTIQVVPLSVGPHPAEGGAFTILRFGDPDVADVVYLEHLTGAIYLDRQEDVTRYMLAMDNLALRSTAPDDTVKVIEKIAAHHAA